MCSMYEINNIKKIISSTLLKTGPFAISELENQLDTSRSWLNKILQSLVDGNILRMNQKTGSAVKYRLDNNRGALEFLFADNESVNIDQLANAWGLGLQAAKRNIKTFVDNGLIVKQGLPPKKIIYRLSLQKDEAIFTETQKEVIGKYYAYVTPDGQLLKGVSGFLYWAKNKSGRNDIAALAQEYLDTRQKFYKDQDKIFLIDATEKIKQVFSDDVKLEKLFHRDFDALPVFGKTYLSQMIRIAKSGQNNSAIMSEIVESIRDSINYIIDKYQIEAVGFIPPTVMRKTQLMDFISKKLRLDAPIISIDKYSGLVPVQQKSLKKIEDRILNANKTIVVSGGQNYGNILLIDDVTGSGATLNETAKKILEQKMAKKIYAFSITGSAKANDFEVISEA